jgi:hypothetical protein
VEIGSDQRSASLGGLALGLASPGLLPTDGRSSACLLRTFFLKLGKRYYTSSYEKYLV